VFTDPAKAPDGADRVMKIIGLGCDQSDGHVRITRGEDFEVYFGSDASHDDMFALCRLIGERAETLGKKISELSESELLALIAELDAS